MTQKKQDYDVLLVSEVLKRVAEDSPRRRTLPEARYFWLTSQLMPNRAVQERALKPMSVLQVAAHTIVALCWAFIITWKWTTIKSWVGAPDLPGRVMDAALGAGAVPLSFLAIVGGLLCITTVVVLHSVFAEE